MEACTSKTWTWVTTISHVTRVDLVRRAIIPTPLLSEIAWSRQTTVVKILRKLEEVFNFWKNECPHVISKSTRPLTRITRNINQRVLETVRATTNQIITNSLLMFQSHQEHQTNVHTWMLRLNPNSRMREETKTTEKFSNQMQVRAKVTTKEILSKMSTMLFLVERLADKEGNQAFRNLTIKMKVSSTSPRDMINQFGKYLKKISQTQSIWMFIKRKTTEDNSPLQLHHQAVSIITIQIIRLGIIMANKELLIVHRWIRVSHTSLHFPRAQHLDNNSNSFQEPNRNRQFKWWVSTRQRVSVTLKLQLMLVLDLATQIYLMNMEKLGDYYLATTVEENSTNRLWWSMRRSVRKFL